MLWVSNDSALPFAFDTCSIRVPYLHWLSIRVRYVFVLAFDSCPLCVRVCVSALCDRRVTRYPKLRAASAAFEAHTRTHTHTQSPRPLGKRVVVDVLPGLKGKVPRLRSDGTVCA